MFCYWGGENGYFASKCKKAENQSKVIHKLIQSSQKSPVTCNVHVVAKKSAVDIESTLKIPDMYWFGTPLCEPIKVNRHLCNAQLDSGLQVTIIFESWYGKYISDVPTHPVQEPWYLEFFEISSKKITASPETMYVLALTCPTPQDPEQTAIIVGTP